jgi:hypothetical protein
MPLTLSSAAPMEWSTRFVRWWRGYGCGVVGCSAVMHARARWSNGDGDGDSVLRAERMRGKGGELKEMGSVMALLRLSRSDRWARGQRTDDTARPRDGHGLRPISH